MACELMYVKANSQYITGGLGGQELHRDGGIWEQQVENYKLFF